MTAQRIWTAVSYNWSAGNTHINVFYGPHPSEDAKLEFENSYPGENLIALIPGNHELSSTAYSLKYPDQK